jgi:hypothetical protein
MHATKTSNSMGCPPFCEKSKVAAARFVLLPFAAKCGRSAQLAVGEPGKRGPIARNHYRGAMWAQHGRGEGIRCKGQGISGEKERGGDYAAACCGLLALSRV